MRITYSNCLLAYLKKIPIILERLEARMLESDREPIKDDEKWMELAMAEGLLPINLREILETFEES